ncbi:MAG: hypothetical protein AB1801_27820, partial [Chloroflexota bacterium]
MQHSGDRAGQVKQIPGRYVLRGLLIAIIFAMVGTAILTYQFAPDNVTNLALGDVVPEDIFAPSQIVFVSQTDTEAERERARTAVSIIYSPPDPKVARQQVNRLQKIFAYLDTVRADPYGSLAEKAEWIAAIPDLTLSDTVIDQVQTMNDQAWEETKQEALLILDQAMRAEIRESQVLSTRRQLPTRVALDTPDEQAMVIVAITEDLIKPNTFPDETRTETERQTATDAVKPAVTTYEQNELIIPAGQIVGPKELEALQALGLQKPKF